MFKFGTKIIFISIKNKKSGGSHSRSGHSPRKGRSSDPLGIYGPVPPFMTKRKEEIFKFLQQQMYKFEKLSKSIQKNMKKYQKFRKKMWQENDKLNKFENEKVYQDDLNKLLAGFKNSKLQITQKMEKEYKKMQKKSSKWSEKKLIKKLKKIAKKVNKKKVHMNFSLSSEVEAMREMDYEYMEQYEDALKMANLKQELFK